MADHQVLAHRGRGRPRVGSREEKRQNRRLPRRATAGDISGADLALRGQATSSQDCQPCLVHVLVRRSHPADVPGVSLAACAHRLLAHHACVSLYHGRLLRSFCCRGTAIWHPIAAVNRPNSGVGHLLEYL